MKLYAYCLTEGVEPVPEKIKGINGAEVRLYKTEDFSLPVSDVFSETIPASRENALAHAAVVRSVLDRTTPLPFRFGVLVTEEQLQNYLATRRDALLANLARVRGCVEMNVKIISDAKEHALADRQAKEKPGTAFLAAKMRGATEAKDVTGWLERLLGGAVRETRIETNLTNQLIVSAAHLVERGAVDSYRRTVQEGRAERPELKFLISGPWPPYSFANIELEFHTQFGVS